MLYLITLFNSYPKKVNKIFVIFLFESVKNSVYLRYFNKEILIEKILNFT